MYSRHIRGLRRYLRQAISTLATVSLSVVITVFVMRVLTPQHAHAQGTPGVVQASEFDLVGQNGTVLARLQPGGEGNGQLRLYDSSGNRRLELVGRGALNVFDPDGNTLRFQAGYTVTASPSTGAPPINGVFLDPNGTVGYLPAAGGAPATRTGCMLGAAAAGGPQNCIANLAVTANPTLGNILTDARGNTIYYYDDPTSAAAQDPLSCPYGPELGKGGSGKVGTCLSAWPPVLTSDLPATPPGLTGVLGVVNRTDEHDILQVTYNGAPLYYFNGDRAPGDTSGNGVNAFGGHWQVVTVP